MLRQTIDRLTRLNRTGDILTLDEMRVTQARIDRMKALARKATLLLTDHDLAAVRDILAQIGRI